MLPGSVFAVTTVVALLLSCVLGWVWSRYRVPEWFRPARITIHIFAFYFFVIPFIILIGALLDWGILLLVFWFLYVLGTALALFFVDLREIGIEVA